jgi:toxin-antitoxin system PIN domain toxin
MRALLDVNVLIALHDQDHVHHRQAARWLTEHARLGWASCPVTQNGCLRIMSQPGYPNVQPLAVLVAMLQRSTQAPQHAFWPDDTSVLDNGAFEHRHIHSARQLTDLYLLSLAVRHGGRLVTFDQRAPLSAVRSAEPRHLLVL